VNCLEVASRWSFPENCPDRVSRPSSRAGWCLDRVSRPSFPAGCCLDRVSRPSSRAGCCLDLEYRLSPARYRPAAL
jgi:hypothetical protein